MAGAPYAWLLLRRRRRPKRPAIQAQLSQPVRHGAAIPAVGRTLALRVLRAWTAPSARHGAPQRLVTKMRAPSTLQATAIKARETLTLCLSCSIQRLLLLPPTPMHAHRGRCGVCVAAAATAHAQQRAPLQCPNWCTDVTCHQENCQPCAICQNLVQCAAWWYVLSLHVSPFRLNEAGLHARIHSHTRSRRHSLVLLAVSVCTARTQLAAGMNAPNAIYVTRLRQRQMQQRVQRALHGVPSLL